MKLIFVRHGQTYDNVNHILSGNKIDASLNENGVNQAKKTGLQLKNEKIDIAYVSTMGRARDTAKAVLKFHPKAKIIFSDSLVDVDHGNLTGLKYKDFHDAVKKSGKTYVNFKPHDGESTEDLKKRIRKFYDDVIVKNHDNTVLIVGHADPIAVLISHIFGEHINEFEKYRINNAGITILEVNEDSHAIHALNYTKHLDD